MKVINIRGTTASGKTTLIKEFMKIYKFSEPVTISNGVTGHFSKDYCIIGPYTSKKFGGVDSIKRIEYVIPAIFEALKKRPIILFEGLLVSHSFQKWMDFSMLLQAKQQKQYEEPLGMTWAFIIPPLRENILRLRKRNNIKTTLNSEKGSEFVNNFINRYKSIIRIREKANLYNGNCTPINLDYNTPINTLNKYLLSVAAINNNVLKYKHRSKYQIFMRK